MENRSRRAASWTVDTNRSWASGASWPASTRSAARLCMEKQPSGAGDRSGSHAVQVWDGEGPCDRLQAGGAYEHVESAADVGRTVPLGPHGIANARRELVVAHLDREGRPVGVDERDAATRAHHPRHL